MPHISRRDRGKEQRSRESDDGREGTCSRRSKGYDRRDGKRRRYSRSKGRKFTRSRSRSRSRSETRISTKSQKGESDFAKLTEVLAALVKTGSKNTNKYVNEKVLPEFDPEKKICQLQNG